jgi:hypothetical protein
MSGGAARTLTRPACLRRARKGLVSRAGGSFTVRDLADLGSRRCTGEARPLRRRDDGGSCLGDARGVEAR